MGEHDSEFQMPCCLLWTTKFCILLFLFDLEIPFCQLVDGFVHSVWIALPTVSSDQWCWLIEGECLVCFLGQFSSVQRASEPILPICSMQGMDTSISNYPGKYPQGLDLPSDIAHEKHPEKKAVSWWWCCMWQQSCRSWSRSHLFAWGVHSIGLVKNFLQPKNFR